MDRIEWLPDGHNKVDRSSLPFRLTALLIQRLTLIFTTLIYTFTLYSIYLLEVAPAFAYQGFTYYPLTWKEYVTIAFFVILPTIFAPSNIINVSKYIFFIIYYLVYIPTILMSAFRKPGYPSEDIPLFFALLAAMVILGIFAKLPVLRFARPKLTRLTWKYGLFFSLFAVYAFLVAKFGLHPPPSPLNPYDVRLAAREVGPLAGYLLRTAGNVLAPAVMAWALFSKRPMREWLLLFSIFLFILVYSFDGTKSTLFSPILIYSIWIIYKYKITISKIIIYISILLIISIIVDILLGKPILTAIGIRRLAFTPGLLTGYYYEYFIFQKHQIYFYSHSFLSSFFENPYGVAPAFLIGKLYLGSEVASANANLFADAIANIGLIGVPLLAIMAGLYVYLLRVLSGGCEVVALLLAAVPIFALTNTSFFTALLTHGLFLSGFLIWLFPKKYIINECYPNKIK